MQQQPKAEYSVVQGAPQVSAQDKERALHNQAAQADENIEPINTGQADYTIGKPNTDEQVGQSTGGEQADTAAPPIQDEGLVRVLDGTEPPSVDEPQKSSYKNQDLQKLEQFMDDTGGSLEDYMNLNKDYDTFEDDKLLKEYYTTTKPGYSSEEIDLYMESIFGDEDEFTDKESKEYKFAQLKKKEALLEAKAHLNNQKSKYYQDLKSSNGNRHIGEEQQRQQQELANHFTNKTNEVFSEDFNGFVFDTDGGKFKYSINDVGGVKDFQSNIDNFFGEHLDEKGYVKDAGKYHKALWASQNADKIASFFYNQGKSDAVSASARESKNIDMSPQKHPSNAGQPKAPYRVVDSPGSKNELKISSRFKQ